MKRLLLIPLVLFLACEKPVREEIVQRYTDGSKKFSIVYEGKGKDEVIKEKIK